MVFIEQYMGRKWGKFVLFATNSQGIIDIYSISHVIHGILFYCLFSYFFTSILWIIVLSVAAECLWEVFENTSWTIARYRKTVAIDYQGDTILNSISDVLVMMIGVLIAIKFTVVAIIIFILELEFIALIFVRDNLCLNIIMLIYPFESIKKWQLSKITKEE